MKCEKGDLAKIIMSIRRENIGKTVTVDGYVGHFKQNETFNFRGLECAAIITDHYWWISIHGDDELQNMWGGSPKAYIPDSWLEPIRPDKKKETEKEDLELFA